jgi:hypothetical protein
MLLLVCCVAAPRHDWQLSSQQAVPWVTPHKPNISRPFPPPNPTAHQLPVYNTHIPTQAGAQQPYCLPHPA